MLSLDASQKTELHGEEITPNKALVELLPYDNPYVLNYWGNSAISDEIDEVIEEKNQINFSIPSAVSYATSYATSPNTPSYYYFSHSDCTNFMSQILEASGVSQEVYDVTGQYKISINGHEK